MFLDGEVGGEEVCAFSFHIAVRLFLCCKEEFSVSVDKLVPCKGGFRVIKDIFKFQTSAEGERVLHYPSTKN